eukprot:3034195-Rhodomonas_salina.1
MEQQLRKQLAAQAEEIKRLRTTTDSKSSAQSLGWRVEGHSTDETEREGVDWKGVAESRGQQLAGSSLRVRYAMPGTEAGGGPKGRIPLFCYALAALAVPRPILTHGMRLPGLRRRYRSRQRRWGPFVFRVCEAVSGTDLTYGPTPGRGAGA